MKNVRFVLEILFLGCLALSQTTCGGSSTATLTSISVPASIPVGANRQFTSIGGYSDGTEHDITTQATWVSSDTSLVTVTSTGLATAVAPGTVTITATLEGISVTIQLTVTSATLSSISVTPNNPSIPWNLTLHLSQQFLAMGTFSDGTSHDITTQLGWSSSNTSVATINRNGLARTWATGTTTITATLGSISGSTNLTATFFTVPFPTLTPVNPSAPAGVLQQFLVMGKFSDGTSYDITDQVIWSSSNTSVATINRNGLARALATGATTITGTIYDSHMSLHPQIVGTHLTVTSATLSSLSVTPTLPMGTIQQFLAIGVFFDGTSQDLTNQVLWSSSNPSVATIGSNGVATALSTGSTVIVATLPGTIQGATRFSVFP